MRTLCLLALGGNAAVPLFSTARPEDSPIGVRPVDIHANAPTRLLLQNLHRWSGRLVLFGHQNSLVSGVEWTDERDRSDPKDVTGSYPAVFGWDIGELELGRDRLIDGVAVEDLRRMILQAHAAGGVITISWHMTHPVSGESSWQRNRGVAELLPGGSAHEKLKACLDAFVRFNETLVAMHNGPEPIPVIFRPWHEHTGDWFWWGRHNATEAEFAALWRFTVEYLRDDRQQHNLLYAYSPDRSRIDLSQFEAGYLYGYPGNAYVDILGLDNYWDLGHPANKASEQSQRADFARSLEYLGQLAAQRRKLPALTECGQDSVPDPQFWTGRLLEGLLANNDTRRIGYVLVWRNAYRQEDQPKHFFVPHRGHPSAPDFVKFRQHPTVVFLDELPGS